MLDPDTHYKRTLATLNGMDLEFELKSNSNPEQLENQLYRHIKKRAIPKSKNHALLHQIYSIEKEKKELRNTQTERFGIFQKEKFIYELREKYLDCAPESYLDSAFCKNPFVFTYESDWNWSMKDLDEEPRVLEKLLSADKSDIYFVFQQTGSYDELSQSNILELPITEYEYFLIYLFEDPKTISAAMKSFQFEFDVNTEEELAQLRQVTLSLIQELIYKTFIVPTAALS